MQLPLNLSHQLDADSDVKILVDNQPAGTPYSAFEDILLRHYSIRASVFSYLDAVSLIRLQRASRIVHELSTEIRRTQWNIDRFLLRWFHRPTCFRFQMAQNEAIISGSAALQFLDRVNYPGSDLDIVFSGYEQDETQSIKAYQKLLNLARYLLKTEGYMPYFKEDEEQFSWWHTNAKTLHDNRTSHIDSKHATRTGYSGLFDIYELRRGDERVQLCLCQGPALEDIINFHSTVVMNFITWNRAYSLFPAYTFGRHEAVINQPIDRRLAPIVKKYQDRGYKFIWKEAGTFGDDKKHPEEDTQFASSIMDPFRRRRCINDSYSWRMDLDTSGLECVEEVMDSSAMDKMAFKATKGRWVGSNFLENPSTRIRIRFFCYRSVIVSEKLVARIVGKMY